MPTKRKKPYKKLTNVQKEFNKGIREQLRESGILPPVKAKLNRKKFLQETFKELDNFQMYDDLPYLVEAIHWMVSRNQEKNITPEQIGVLKMLKIAMTVKSFNEDKLSKGETTYKIDELFKVVEPIKNL